MYFEYSRWTGDSNDSAPPPAPSEARSYSFTYRNVNRGSEDYVLPMQYPEAAPPHEGEENARTHDYVRINAPLPAVYQPQPISFAYATRAPLPQVHLERMFAYEHEWQRRRREWERSLRTGLYPQKNWGTYSEWIQRELEAARRYEDQRSKAHRRLDDYEPHLQGGGYGFPHAGGSNEWSWWRRASAATRHRDTHSHSYSNQYWHAHPHARVHPHSYPGYRHAFPRAPPDVPYPNTGANPSNPPSSSNVHIQTLFRNAVAAYDAAWADLLSSSNEISDSPAQLTFDTVPWPQYPPPKSVDDFDSQAIRKFLGTGPRSLKAMTREALLRYHPDKNAPLLARVAPDEERERVAAGCAAVTRCLGELLRG